jgi:hypothetical protein
MRRGFVIFSLLVSSILVGCASSQKRAELEEATKTYARALKAGDESVLLAFVHPSQQQNFSKNVSPIRDLQFSDVEVRKIFPDEKFDSALVLMNLEFYSREGSSLLSSVRQFAWIYDQQAKAWLLKEPTPFGSK